MITTVLRIGLLRLRNNPLELLLMFVVPIIFFSIFALIFGRGIGSGKSSPVRVIFVDQDQTAIAQNLMDGLSKEPGLERVSENGSRIGREQAMSKIQAGEATLAIVLPRHLGDTLRNSGEPNVELLADTSDQIATQVVSALVRQAVYVERGRLASLASRRSAGEASVPTSDSQEAISKETPHDMITVRDVLASEKANPRISMYAAGIAVMFLLFSASGAGGTLLEEQEEGTLERLLSSQLTVGQLLTGKWIYITVCGSLQLLVMFIYAQLVFHVDLVGHLEGFAVMAVGTAAAAASLSLLLATLCRSRSQLNGISVILILTMSALGGSMVPRYIMSEELRSYGLITFNAWALDGFDKVFWRDLPVRELQPQLFVLLFSAVAMGLAARVCARRWEA
ncbi:MAG: ABC transporter permease [Rubripirellula sp.]